MGQNGQGNAVHPHPALASLPCGPTEPKAGFPQEKRIFKEAFMRMIYLTHSTRTGSRQPWNVIAKLIMGFAAAAALLIIALAGLIIVLPLVLVSGLAAYVYLRRRLRTEKQKRATTDDVIDAEYTIVERND
jgi:hypothetical protein